MKRKYEILRDPIHGFIKLNELEVDLINTMPFQRLRNIRQLAFTNYVYHGGEHSRFGHSLGVMEFATKIFDTLIYKHNKELNWNEERTKKNRQILRLAALLHDIGHPPFSHASEKLFPIDKNNIKLDHEYYIPEIIKATEISSLIDLYKDENNVSSEDIVKFFINPTSDDMPFLKQFIKGDIDADRMDYLLRDSVYTGVHYGKYDYERLINTLCLYKDEEEENFKLAIEYGGIHALEAMILARYFMFTQVYFHRTRRAYDYHLIEFLKSTIEIYPDLNSIKDYLYWDDIEILKLLKDKKDDNDHANRIFYRKHYKKAFSSLEHPVDKEMILCDWLKEKVIKEFSEENIFFDTADKAPHKFESKDFIVLDANGKKQRISNMSGIIKNLKKIHKFRIYTSEKNRDKLEKFCDKWWKDKAK